MLERHVRHADFLDRNLKARIGGLLEYVATLKLQIPVITVLTSIGANKEKPLVFSTVWIKKHILARNQYLLLFLNFPIKVPIFGRKKHITAVRLKLYFFLLCPRINNYILSRERKKKRPQALYQLSSYDIVSNQRLLH